jgi:hypothetical protein
MSFFKSLFSLASKIAPVAIGFALGGPLGIGAAAGAAIGGAAGSALRGGDLGQVIQGGLYGYGGGSALNALSTTGALGGTAQINATSGLGGTAQYSALDAADNGGFFGSLGNQLSALAPASLGGTGGAFGALAGNPLLSLANIGSSLYSASAGRTAANKASQQQIAALQQAQQQQQAAQQQALSNVSPYLTAGAQSAAGLAPLVNDPNAQAAFIRNSPFYQAMANDAKNKLFASAAAKGKLGTGGTADALQNSLLLLGNSLLNDQVSRQQNLAGLGANTATNFNNLYQSGTQNLTGLTTDIGNAGAAGTIGGYNATTGALQNGINTATSLYGIQNGVRL